MARFHAALACLVLLGSAFLGACSGTSTTANDGGDAQAGAASTGGTTSSSGGASSSTGGTVATGGTGSDECSAAAPCAVGVCMAQGDACNDAWTCQNIEIACTKDLAEYCGCDGETFQDSGTCPTRPYSYKGACSSGSDKVNCDPKDIVCVNVQAPEPCPDDKVHSVVDGCHGACVELSQCSCNAADDCPGDNACYNYNKSCGPWLK